MLLYDFPPVLAKSCRVFNDVIDPTDELLEENCHGVE